jgi:dihydroneopterin aldolase
MPDIIRIVDLEVPAHIGVSDAERREPQQLLISLDLVGEPFTHAAGTDNIARTINYYEVSQCVKKLTADHARRLLETLAEELTFELLKAFPIKKITMEIKKFVLADARYVSVIIERTSTGH